MFSLGGSSESEEITTVIEVELVTRSIRRLSEARLFLFPRGPLVFFLLFSRFISQSYLPATRDALTLRPASLISWPQKQTSVSLAPDPTDAASSSWTARLISDPY